MKRSSATTAALTAFALAAAVAFPAAAATGSGSGGTSPDDPQFQSPAQASGYQAVRATWYGPGLFGHKTACGYVLTHRTLGVAHRRLPCGTQVSLEYQGRTVVVPVIDRGPYSRGIAFDLTYATARKLGMSQTSRVRAAALHR